MGTSTNAYLYYGFDFMDQESGIDPFYDREEFESYEDMPYEIIHRLEKETTAKVEIDSHCSDEYPIFFVYTSMRMAWRGESAEIDDLTIHPSWDEEIRKFCEQWGIPFQQPKWRLASYWG